MYISTKKNIMNAKVDDFNVKKVNQIRKFRYHNSFKNFSDLNYSLIMLIVPLPNRQ